jgi:hypothetical protein
MNINYRGLIEILAIVALLIGTLAFITPHASADGNGSVTIEPIVPEPLAFIPRISQGDDAYLNDTLDISGVTGWPDGGGNYRLIYYGRWVDAPAPEDIEPEYILELPGMYRSSTVSSQYRFYIDPAIFSGRSGYWYQWESNFTRSQAGGTSGNLRAFKVIEDFRPVLNATSNETEIYYRPGNYSPKEPPKPEPLLPERHITDILIAKGDPLVWPTPGRLWLFGSTEGRYGVEGDGIPAGSMETLPPGDYTLLVQLPGNNTIYDASCFKIYNGTNVDPYSYCSSLEPGLYGKKAVDVYGMLPPVVHDRLVGMLRGSDDTIEEYSVVVQQPEITINRADEIYINNNTALDVRGYTNTASGTEITVVLDKDSTYYKFVPLRTVKTQAIRTSPGNMSYWRAYVPIDWENLAADARNHTLIARTVHGGEVLRNFKIGVMPPDSCQYPENGICKKNVSLKYIESENPFIPTPTPIVNTVKVVETVRVVETVVTYITPDVQDYGKVFEGGVWWIGTWIVVGILAIVGFFALCYLAWVWWRGRKG